MYKVDRGIEYPDSRTRYPFNDMEVGDSILFTERAPADSARVAALRFARIQTPPWRFSLRTVSNGFRLWRTL